MIWPSVHGDSDGTSQLKLASMTSSATGDSHCKMRSSYRMAAAKIIEKRDVAMFMAYQAMTTHYVCCFYAENR